MMLWCYFCCFLKLHLRREKNCDAHLSSDGSKNLGFTQSCEISACWISLISEWKRWLIIRVIYFSWQMNVGVWVTCRYKAGGCDFFKLWTTRIAKECKRKTQSICVFFICKCTWMYMQMCVCVCASSGINATVRTRAYILPAELGHFMLWRHFDWASQSQKCCLKVKTCLRHFALRVLAKECIMLLLCLHMWLICGI